MPDEGRSVTDETTVNTRELAMVLGITARRVQQMIQDGTLETVKRDLGASEAAREEVEAKYAAEQEKRTLAEEARQLAEAARVKAEKRAERLSFFGLRRVNKKDDDDQ